MITQTLTTSFKLQLLLGQHNFTPNAQSFKIALYSSTASIGADTTVYTATGEITGTGYTAGGKSLIIPSAPTSSGTTAYLTFNDVSWYGANFTATGALIYNATQGNKSVAVLNFGANKTSSNNIFTVQFPANTSTSAIIRIT